MEFEDTMLSGEDEMAHHLDKHTSGLQNRRRQRDEILDSSLSDMTAQSESEIVSFTESEGQDRKLNNQ